MVLIEPRRKKKLTESFGFGGAAGIMVAGEMEGTNVKIMSDTNGNGEVVLS